jgi:hypothetical protein
MRRLSSSFSSSPYSALPSPSIRLFLLAVCIILSYSVVVASPFLLRGDATATAAVMEREKVWIGQQLQQQEQEEWPQDSPQYRGKCKGWGGGKGGKEGRQDSCCHCH